MNVLIFRNVSGILSRFPFYTEEISYDPSWKIARFTRKNKKQFLKKPHQLYISYLCIILMFPTTWNKERVLYLFFWLT